MHTHRTQEGGCRKSQMPSQYRARKSAQRALLGGPGAQGCSTRQAEVPGAQPQLLPCPGDSWEHQEQGCGHGALALTSRETQMCPGGQAAASVPLPAIPRFGSFSLGVREQSCRAQPVNTAAPSFLPRSVFLLCLWQFCPGAGVGIFPSFSSLLQPKQCVLCASCHPVVVPVASELPKVMEPPPPHLQYREEQGCLSPAFSSGFSFWITLTLCLEHGSGCTCYPWTHLGHPCRAGAWPGWVCH